MFVYLYTINSILILSYSKCPPIGFFPSLLGLLSFVFVWLFVCLSVCLIVSSFLKFSPVAHNWMSNWGSCIFYLCPWTRSLTTPVTSIICILCNVGSTLHVINYKGCLILHESDWIIREIVNTYNTLFILMLIRTKTSAHFSRSSLFRIVFLEFYDVFCRTHLTSTFNNVTQTSELPSSL